MRKPAIIYLFFFCFLPGLYAQPPCASNPVANDFCETATPICNLNGYCGNTSPTYTNWVSPTNQTNETNTPLGDVFCATIQNNSWLKFIADSTTAIFDVWVSNCANNKGIQMQIYSTTDCYNFTAVSNCWNPMFPTNGQIIATNLTVGEVYFFMIDGTAGDVCDYVIASSAGVNTTPTITEDQPICPGETVVLSVTGGTDWAWNSNPPDPSLTGQENNSSVTVSPDMTTMYTVTVVDPGMNAFCPNSSDTLTSTVTMNTISPGISSIQPASCGLENGGAVVHAQGGSGTYSWLWSTSPPLTNDTVAGLSPGSYTVTVSDGICDTILSLLVGNIPPPAVTLDSVRPAHCGQPDGAAFLSATGGTPPYSYAWNTIPPQNGQSLQHVPPGIYFVTASDGDCDTILTITIGNIPPPVVSLDSVRPSHCGQPDGAVFISSTGGTPPYSYLWNSLPPQLTPDLLDVTFGNYTVTVTDAANCSSEINAVVSGTEEVTAAVTEIIPAACGQPAGSITVTPLTGQSPFLFVWSSSPPQYSATATGLPPGPYLVTISDANECFTVLSANVPGTAQPEILIQFSPEHCHQGDGSVTASLAGNPPSVSYQWNTGETGQTINSLHSGYYTVTVTAGWCTGSTMQYVPDIPGPEAFFVFSPQSAMVNEDPVSFHDQSTGDVSHWSWKLGDGTTETSKDFTHIYRKAGSYLVTLTVSDDFGCESTCADTVLIRDIFTFYIPDAFTPDGNSQNDGFTPFGINVDPDHFSMTVFNRWGQQVYHTNIWYETGAEPWNGTLENRSSWEEALTGVYVYEIRVREMNGIWHHYTGIVTLVR